MILRDLIEALQQLIDDEECTGDELVLFAHQPNYPLQCYVSGPIVYCSEDEEIETIELDMKHPEVVEAEVEAAELRIAELRSSRKPIVYLSESGTPSDPYAPRAAWGD